MAEQMKAEQMDSQSTNPRTTVLRLAVAIACVVELMLWVVAFAAMYYIVPVSVDKFSDAGLSIPLSMNRVIGLCDFGVRYFWVTIPLILAVIVVPKAVVRSQLNSAPVLFMLALIGACIPITFFIYGTGLPKLHELGLWP